MAFVGNSDTERRYMKYWAGAGIAVITVGLFALNTSGAWGASGNNLWYTMAVGGAEILVAVAFGFTVLAQTWIRRIVCGLIFAVLLWACIENGKLAIQRSFSDVFIDTSEALRAKALVAEAEAIEIDGMKVDVRANAGEDLSRVRNEIAELNLELDLMTSQTRIAEAQTRLAALGLYTGRIDGIRAELTESAMRGRGETIRRRLAVLETREASAGTITGVAAAEDPAAAKRLEAIRLNTAADEVDYRTFWMHLILIALEGARSFGVWAFLMVSTVRRKEIDEQVSDDVPAGFVDIRFREDQWAEREKSWEDYLKRKRAGEDKAPSGSPLRLGNKEWVRQTKQKIQARYDEGLSPQEIADSFGFGWGEYENLITKMFNAKAARKYLGQPPIAVPEPDPRAATPPVEEPEPPAPDAEEPEAPVAVADSPQERNSDDAQNDAFEADPVEDTGNSADPEPASEEAEPEPPKDYPLEPYDPNRKANGATDDIPKQ